MAEVTDNMDGANLESGTRRAALRVSFAPGSSPGGPDSQGPSAGAGPLLVELEAAGRLVVDGEPLEGTIELDELPNGRLTLGSNARPVLVFDLPDPRRSALGIRRLEVLVDGWRFEVDVDSDARARLRERATSARGDAAKGGPAEVRAIIPGRVVSVDVAEGDSVEPGDRLLVLEAMKMQNELKAPRAGTVARLAAGPGQTVELGDVLLVIE